MRRYLAVALLLLTSCSSSTPPPAAAQATPMLASYSTDTGSYAVGVIPDATLHDGKRNKDLAMTIEYPIHGLSFPLIVFSHGFGGAANAYEPLVSYWTSYGYVVIRPSHADAGALREIYEQGRITAPSRDRVREERRPRGNRNQQQPAAPAVAEFVKNAEEAWDKEREPQWRDRADDVSFVLDSLDELEQKYPELRGKIDRSRIGVGGHSYGALTTMLVGGARTFSNPPIVAGDPRVKAALAMSPQGVSESRGLTAQSWTNVKIPMLYMTGSNDFGAKKEEDPDWRRTAFVNSPPGDKYFILLEGARHLSFTGRLSDLPEGFGPRRTDAPIGTQMPGQPVMTDQGAYQPRSSAGLFGAERMIFSTIKQISLAFWDGFLKNNAKGREYLDKSLEASRSATVKVERK